MASNITLEGSLPWFFVTTRAPTRSPQILSCSAAPARNVSPAAITTLLPSFCNLLAIFAIVVVLPLPLTPTNKNTERPVLLRRRLELTISPFRYKSNILSIIIGWISLMSFISLTRGSAFSSSINFTVVSTPISAITNISSSSSKNSSVTSL